MPARGLAVLALSRRILGTGVGVSCVVASVLVATACGIGSGESTGNGFTFTELSVAFDDEPSRACFVFRDDANQGLDGFCADFVELDGGRPAIEYLSSPSSARVQSQVIDSGCSAAAVASPSSWAGCRVDLRIDAETCETAMVMTVITVDPDRVREVRGVCFLGSVRIERDPPG
jgi:hypothetical protein